MTYPYIPDTKPTLLQRWARAIWTRQCAREFARRLRTGKADDWSDSQLEAIAGSVADSNAEHGDTYGWLFGRLRVTPAEAVQDELECWEE